MSSLATKLAWLLVIAAGVWLRFFRISEQIPLDDEIHALAKLTTSGYVGIATTFGGADHSIPLTLFYKWIAERGWLSEYWMYAPSLVAGIATLGFGCWLARRHSSGPVALMFVALLCVSPVLVFFTRQARPYALTLFLGLVAVWAAWRFAESGRRRYLAVHVASGALAVWLHLVVMPFVFGAWVFLLCEWAIFDRTNLRRGLEIVLCGSLAGLMAGALLAAPLIHDWRSLYTKSGLDHVTLFSGWRALHLLLGSRWSLLVLLLVALAAVGTLHLARRHPRAVAFVATLIVLQVASVLASRTLMISHPLILSRYLLLCLPPVLFAAATGFEAIAARLPRPHIIGPALGVCVVAASWAGGPLPAELRYPNAFFEDLIYFEDIDPKYNKLIPILRTGGTPTFYQNLASASPGSVTLIEAPWRFESVFNRLPLFQRVHHQRVEIGMVGKLCPPGAYAEQPIAFPNRFRHFIDLSAPVESLRARADYVVFHRKLELPNMPDERMRYEGRGLPDIEQCIVSFQSRIGSPIFEDDTITVFALRSRGTAPMQASSTSDKTQ